MGFISTDFSMVSSTKRVPWSFIDHSKFGTWCNQEGACDQLLLLGPHMWRLTSNVMWASNFLAIKLGFSNHNGGSTKIKNVTLGVYLIISTNK